jgi:predicted permease
VRVIRNFLRRRTLQQDAAAEIESHLEERAAELMEGGMSERDARAQARREFGNVALLAEDSRSVWSWTWLEILLQDIRYAARTLRRTPGFTAVAILSLALGIGANTAIFSVFEAVSLRLLPVRDPKQLVFVWMAGKAGRDGPPYPLFELIRDQARSFEQVAAFSPSGMEVMTADSRELARGVWVSGNLYETLGVRPLLGRRLTASDDRMPGQEGADSGAVVISQAYWQQRFGGDSAIIGRAFYLFDHPVTVVGVMPNDAIAPDPGRPVDIAAPMMLSSPARMRDRTATWLFVIARLARGTAAKQARAEAEALFQAYMAGVQMPPETRQRIFTRMEISHAAKGLDHLHRQFSKPLAALMILAALVLLASCVNVLSLMLARAMARQRDFAVRLAIGAGRGRLIRQSVTEALVVVSAAALLGIVLAHFGAASLTAFFAGGNTPIMVDVSLNSRVLLFSLALGALTALAVGIGPALRSARMDPASGLHGSSRSVAGNRASAALGRGMVMAQVALSMVLLAGAGLFIRSLRGLEKVDLGFIREAMLTMEVAPERRLNGSSEWLTLQAEVLERVRRIPGIRAAGWATMNPISGRDRGAVVAVPGFTPQLESDKDIHLAAVSPEYFETLGVRLLLGRGFGSGDHARSPKVAIVNETAARFYFGHSNPIGRKVRFVNYPGRDLLYEVVGVTRDIIHDEIREPASRFIYVPILQSLDRINRLALVVRCSGDAMAFAEPVRRHIQSARSTLLITNVSTIENQIARSLLRERVVASISIVFGAMALALAGIGLYGLLAYTVTRRTNEIGIRMALGATTSGVVRMILREGFVLTAAGIAAAVPLVLLVGRVSKTLLYGIAPLDLPALGSAAFVLFVLSAIATAAPARRASSLDPSAALRRE